MKGLLNYLRGFFISVLGSFSWQKPRWVNKIIQQVRFRPLRFFSVCGSIIIILLGSYFVLNWYLHRPTQNLPTAVITIPQIPSINDKPEAVTPLTINFIKHVPSEDDPDTMESVPQSVAPLNNINKVVTSGVTLTPELPGKWRWNSDNELTFYPTKPWAAGETYQIKFKHSVFRSAHSFREIYLSIYHDALNCVRKRIKILPKSTRS